MIKCGVYAVLMLLSLSASGIKPYDDHCLMPV